MFQQGRGGGERGLNVLVEEVDDENFPFNQSPYL
jgi:hypothetical protein